MIKWLSKAKKKKLRVKIYQIFIFDEKLRAFKKKMIMKIEKKMKIKAAVKFLNINHSCVTPRISSDE